MPRYAINTTVSSERSRAEIETLLRRYEASGFGYMWKGDSAVVMFEMHSRRIRFTLPLPVKDNPMYMKTPTGRVKRNLDSISSAWEQDCRSRWRGLVLCIKAKLESVEANIETFEEAFLPHIVLPNNHTAGEFLIPQIANVYKHGKMPLLLSAPKALKGEVVDGP